ncbi:hypothetical protein [Microbacterium sp. P5_E9]
MSRSPRPHRLAAALAVVGAVVGLTACASQPAGAVDDVVVVVGAHMGAPALQAELLAQALSLLDAEGDRLTVVVGDGSPFVAIDYTIPALPGNSIDRSEWLEKLRDDATGAILEEVAATDEVDLAEAIALAAEAFRPEAAHTLTVLDPGLPSMGDLSLLEGRLYAEPTDLVTVVEQHGGLPDLSSVRIRMPRLGIVADPQEPLTEDARTALSAIWTEYFARAGATDVELEPVNMTAQPQSHGDLPFVTPVPIERPLPPPPSACSQQLADTTIGFAAGSAELTDVAATTRSIDGLVAELASCPGNWIVEGSASSEGGDAGFNEALSLARAERIRAMVADAAQIDSAAIEVRGWGVSWPCRVPDIDASGHLILNAAVRNRAVVVSKGEPGEC